MFAADVDGDGDIDVLSAGDDKIAWYENLSPIPGPAADLTGNGFVDFDDLAILLINWDQNVSAALGNLVDAENTRVNFDDLAVLLSAWTGPRPAASPQLARPLNESTESTDTEPQRSPQRAARDELFSRLARADRRQHGVRRVAHVPLRRLQATGIDRAMTDPADLTRLARRGHAI